MVFVFRARKKSNIGTLDGFSAAQNIWQPNMVLPAL